MLSQEKGAVPVVIEQAPTSEGSSVAGRSVLPGGQQPDAGTGELGERPQRPHDRSRRH